MGYKKVTIVKEYFGHKKKKDKQKKHDHQILHLDVPLMLQIFEFVRHHCKEEGELHDMLHKLCELCHEEPFLMIKHFERIANIQEREEGVVVETRKFSR